MTIFGLKSSLLLRYCWLITLLSNFLVNFLVIFLLGSISKVVFDKWSLVVKLMIDNIFIWKNSQNFKGH